MSIQLLDAQGREQDDDGCVIPSPYRNCPRCLNTAVIEDGYCGHCRECTMPPLIQDPSPHIAKIPLRAEYRALLQAAAAYEANAERLKLLAQQAREQAANLKAAANL